MAKPAINQRLMEPSPPIRCLSARSGVPALSTAGTDSPQARSDPELTTVATAVRERSQSSPHQNGVRGGGKNGSNPCCPDGGDLGVPDLDRGGGRASADLHRLPEGHARRQHPEPDAARHRPGWAGLLQIWKPDTRQTVTAGKL